jgi:hypothetical protein
VLADTTSRTIVGTPGQIKRQAEQAEVATLLQQPTLTPLSVQLVPQEQPRRRASWPAAVTAAVEAPVAAEQIGPASGVLWADWERGKRRPPC